MKHATIDTMKAMKFTGMADAFLASMQTNQNQKFTADEFINYLVQAEWDYRQNKKVSLAMKRARFRYQAIMEDVDFTPGRGLDKNQILRLSDCSFVEKSECVLIAGATGVGKSYLASALGHQACSKGYRVLYFNTAKLFSKLRMSKADASYIREINKLAKHDLLILDDFGLHPLDAQTRLMLLEIIEDRHGKRSTIIASQIPIAKWYEMLEEETIADAILDRLIHNAHRIELKGESMRKKKAKKIS